MIVVDLSLALICFAGTCHNALVGDTTPVGEFTLTQRLTQQPGYGGDVLQFTETKDMWLAIHRVWTLKPAERRAQKLMSANPEDRQRVTNGCINVSAEVYDELLKCCSRQQLKIKE